MAARTTLDADNTKPAVTQPGDGAHDTTDPAERASTVLPAPSPETIRSGVGVVNSQLPLEPIAAPATGRRSKDDRIEEYDVLGPDGKRVRVRRNVETGETRRIESTDTGTTPTQQARA